MDPREAIAAQAFLSHHSFVKGLALRHAPLPGVADDIVQQVFVEFLSKAASWDLSSDIRPLLATMTRNISLRLWREKTRAMPDAVRALAEHIRALADERGETPAYEDELTALRNCLAKLPDKSRSLVDLYYYGGVSTREIGQRLDMKPDTICRAMSRLREKLRECIDRVLTRGATHV
jgi:RNA polymerase sigma factor (sigma-70 family)